MAARIRSELSELEQVVERAEGAILRATRRIRDRDYFLAAAALALYGFYSGMERLFELISSGIDESLPSGRQWHRDLLAQMALAVPDLRPAVLSPEARTALQEYLEFRHVVRNLYSFNLRPERVRALVRGLRPAFEVAGRDLLAFADFLEDLSTADAEHES